MLRQWIGLGAAAAVIAAGAGSAIFFLRKPDTPSVRPDIALDTSERLIHRKPLPPGVKLRKVKVSATATTVPPASMENLLSNFYVHADPNGLTVPEALAALEQAIRESNLLHRPELAALRFTAGTSIIPPIMSDFEGEPIPELRYERNSYPVGDPDSKIASLLSPPFTIRDYLNVCGLFREVTQQPGGVRYAARRAAIHPLDKTGLHTTLTSRTFLLSPDYYSRWLPFDLSQSSIRWNRFGVSLGKNETLDVPEDGSSLTVTSSEAKLDRIEQILNVQQRIVQHFITTKFILCPPELLPSDFDSGTGMLLSDAEFQAFCLRLSQDSGTDIATAPSIVVRSGQASEVQILRELGWRPGPVEPLQSDWFGLREELQTTPVGETIQVSGLIDLGLPAISGVETFPEILGNSSASLAYGTEEVTHHRTGFDLWVPDGYTAIFTLDVKTDDPRVAIACVTVQALDVAGRLLSR